MGTHAFAGTRRSPAILKLATVGAIAAVLPASAGTFTWLSTNTAAGPYNWNSSGNWTTDAGTYPLAAGDIATATANMKANAVINLNEAITLGALTLGDTDNTHTITIAPNGGSLTFDNGSSDAQFDVVSTSKGDTVSAGIGLKSNLVLTQNSTNTLTISGVISGSGNFTKTGSGILSLRNSNTYTGTTAILAGTVDVSQANSLGTATSAVLLGDTTGSANVTFRSTDTSTAWTGPSISRSFVIQSGNTGTVTIASSKNSSNFTFSGTITLGSDNSTGHDLTISSAGADWGTTTISGLIKDPAGLTGAGGVVTFLSSPNGYLDITNGSNSFTGGSVLKSGNLSLASTGNSLGTGTFIIDGGNIKQNSRNGVTGNINQVWNKDFSVSAKDGTRTVSFGTGAVQLGMTGTDAVRTVTVGTNVSSLTVGGVISDGSNGYTNSLIKDGTGALILSNTANLYTGTTLIKAGTLSLGAAAGNGSGSLGTSTSDVLLGATSGTGNAAISSSITTGTAFGRNLVIQSGNTGTAAFNAGNGSGTLVSSGNVTLGSANGAGHGLTITVAQWGSANFKGSIQDPTGLLADTAGAITLSGQGTVILSGSNSYSGNTILNSGVLSVGNSYALGTGTLIINGGSLNNTNANWTLATNNPQIWNNNFGYNNGGGSLNMGTGAISLTGSRTVSVTINTLTEGGIISDDGNHYALTYAGGSFSNGLALTGANTFGGGVTIVGGSGASTLSAGNASALGSGQTRLTSNANSILNLTSDLTVDSLTSGVTTPTITNKGSGYSTLPTVEISGGGGTGATAIATSTTTGQVTGITITNYGTGYTSAPTFTLVGTTTGTVAVVTGNFAASKITLGTKNLTIAGTNVDPATYSGVISGSGSLVKDGSGIQVLTGANTYTGTTRINNGVLTIDGAGSINSSTAIVLNGGELKYNSSTALTKAVTFTSGKLSGTGSINTAITVGSGAILSPGNSPGSQSFTDLTWTTGGEYLWEINDPAGTAGANPGWDLINVGGTLNISGLDSSNRFNLNITGLEGVGTAPATTTSWTILNYGTLNGSFSADLFSLNASGFDASWNGTWSIADTGSSLQLTYSVPEPAMLALLGLGGLALLRRRRNPN